MTDSYYDSIAAGYNQLHGDEQLTKLKLILPHVRHWFSASNLKLLDVGCGTGISTDFWSQFGVEAIGIDPSIGLLSQNTTPKSKLIHAFAEKIPFADDSFDIVVSFTAIQNFTDIAKGLDEINRVGKKRFILTCLAKSSQLSLVKEEIKRIFQTYTQIPLDKDIAWIIEKPSKSL